MISFLKFFNPIFQKDLWHSGSFLVLASIITSATNFGIVYILANYIPPETYGAYKYILAVVGVLSTTTLQGMNIAILRSVSRGFEGSLEEGLKSKIKFGLFGTTFGFLVSCYYFLQGNEVLGMSFLLAAVSIPFFGTFNIYRSYLNGKKYFKEIAKENLFYSIIFF